MVYTLCYPPIGATNSDWQKMKPQLRECNSKYTTSKTMRKHERSCIYCGEINFVTRDHVPPRSMFPENLPNDVQMVTAPACQRCHKANMKDDTIIRNILISTQESEKHPEVILSLAGKRNRSLARSLERTGGEFRELLQTMKLVSARTLPENNPGWKWAFDFDNPTINRFMERLSRALLWHEFGQPYFKGEFDWRMNVEMPDLFSEAMLRFGCARKVCDVFSYGVIPLQDPDPSWVIANFYGSIDFFVRILKTQ
jgi:hypothetical protein